MSKKETGKQKKLRGQAAEVAVARRLQQMGYLILARNYRAWQLGELDIVAQKNDMIFFVEIKARNNSDQWGGPAAAITARKLGNMRKSALFLPGKKIFCIIK